MAHINAGAKKCVISAPAGKDLKTIVFSVNEDTLTTDENGVAEFRGFYGGYDVEICTDDATVRAELSSSKKQTNAFTFTV